MSEKEKYHQAAALMCIGVKDKDVATALSMTPQTICNWKRKLEFNRILNEHKEAVNLENRTQLRGLAQKAIQRLDELLDVEDPRVRLRAISVVLDAQGYYKSLQEGYYIQNADVKNVDMDFSLE